MLSAGPGFDSQFPQNKKIEIDLLQVFRLFLAAKISVETSTVCGRHAAA